MTLPKADKRSSQRRKRTWSGRELRMCCNSWSVVDDGTRRPCRLPTVRRPTTRQSPAETNVSWFPEHTATHRWKNEWLVFDLSVHFRRWNRNSAIHRYRPNNKHWSNEQTSQYHCCFRIVYAPPWWFKRDVNQDNYSVTVSKWHWRRKRNDDIYIDRHDAREVLAQEWVNNRLRTKKQSESFFSQPRSCESTYDGQIETCEVRSLDWTTSFFVSDA